MIRCILAGLSLAALTAAAPATTIAGRWLTPDGSAVIAIAPCGPSLCGHIARVIKGPPSGPAVDSNNPDPKLRTRPLVGVPILTALVPDGDSWTGRVYDPKGGRTYRAIVARDGAKLKVQGCIAFICKTMLWTPA
ncbi:DUF2147 domain-containing protein [Sphingomonas sp.]|jgi:uncharacterized protein (DUF2147 family)|uniref:DUF2147 domain-containing protein n=1 Tax=Sphingomonas sp. TaxID=28214 RepID=UPI002E359072|nr:DUF2147 domain-containing protein [Sphingomonas sp.]HEX4695477.1 DUF2147 domain-containing protein [Sphingomonas sp.]